MPAFAVIDKTAYEIEQKPYATLLIHFAEPADKAKFEHDTGLTIPITKVIWYPKPPAARFGS